MTPTAEQRLREVRDRIRRAEDRHGRPPGSVRLIGVAKVHSAGSIRRLVELGLADIGESYVQEALHKQTLLRDLPITWHFIGRIQSNKTREIAESFDWVHSLDRLKIARRLSAQRPGDRADLNVCLQVKLEEDEAKGGLVAGALDEVADAVVALPRLRLRGLMVIPNEDDDVDTQRAVFARARSLLDQMARRGLDVDTLSMGMSGDMETAIAEGSTMVRVGTALFGPRPPRPRTD